MLKITIKKIYLSKIETSFLTSKNELKCLVKHSFNFFILFSFLLSHPISSQLVHGYHFTYLWKIILDLFHWKERVNGKKRVLLSWNSDPVHMEAATKYGIKCVDPIYSTKSPSSNYTPIFHLSHFLLLY